MNECKYIKNNATNEDAYSDCQLVAGSINDEKSFQGADFGLVMYYINNILEALEKQIPKKPVTYGEIKNYADCPMCGNTVRGINKPFGEFCSKCGQKLDWSEAE